VGSGDGDPQRQKPRSGEPAYHPNRRSPNAEATIENCRNRRQLFPHSFRATGITNYLENGETLEVAQRIAGHADSHTTKLLTYRVTALYSGFDPALAASAGLKHFLKRRTGT
jgi:integrase